MPYIVHHRTMTQAELDYLHANYYDSEIIFPGRRTLCVTTLAPGVDPETEAARVVQPGERYVVLDTYPGKAALLEMTEAGEVRPSLDGAKRQARYRAAVKARKDMERLRQREDIGEDVSAAKAVVRQRKRDSDARIAAARTVEEALATI